MNSWHPLAVSRARLCVGYAGDATTGRFGCASSVRECVKRRTKRARVHMGTPHLIPVCEGVHEAPWCARKGVKHEEGCEAPCSPALDGLAKQARVHMGNPSPSPTGHPAQCAQIDPPPALTPTSPCATPVRQPELTSKLSRGKPSHCGPPHRPPTPPSGSSLSFGKPEVATWAAASPNPPDPRSHSKRRTTNNEPQAVADTRTDIMPENGGHMDNGQCQPEGVGGGIHSPPWCPPHTTLPHPRVPIRPNTTPARHPSPTLVYLYMRPHPRHPDLHSRPCSRILSPAHIPALAHTRVCTSALTHAPVVPLFTHPALVSYLTTLITIAAHPHAASHLATRSYHTNCSLTPSTLAASFATSIDMCNDVARLNGGTRVSGSTGAWIDGPAHGLKLVRPWCSRVLAAADPGYSRTRL
ncbi:hypothetical protein BD779DRAFT_1470901 [Infundibulicybe gibba]|nr:hypothetical protein BD779DRAFT_1470901 [Infundibulicybe gibba]